MSNIQKTKIKDFQIYYKDKKEYHILKNEIFRDEIYLIEIEKEEPVIVDIGSHIGLSVIYFKSKFPESTIISLEPHPINFEILEKNIFENNLQKIWTGQRAISTKKEKRYMYYSENNLSTTSFKKNAWDGKEKKQEKILVDCISLNELIDKETDILKLDIEGIEEEVILNSKNALELVSNLIFEYHFLRKNRLEKTLKFLKSIGFKTQENQKMNVGEMKVLKFFKN